MVIKEHEEERAEMRGKGRAEWDLVQYTAKNLVCSLVLSYLSYCVEVLGILRKVNYNHCIYCKKEL